MTVTGPVIVDAGLLFAAADADDRSHAEAVAVLEALETEHLTLPVTVVAEAAWMIGRRLGRNVEAAFLESVAMGEFSRVDLSDDDWSRVAQLTAGNGGSNLGVIDASVVAVAERLGVTSLATFNRRDFGTVRPRHCESFQLVP
jgi:predicted nucleic acid-binding protein